MNGYGNGLNDREESDKTKHLFVLILIISVHECENAIEPLLKDGSSLQCSFKCLT